jgi:hypothetical protein
MLAQYGAARTCRPLPFRQIWMASQGVQPLVATCKTLLSFFDKGFIYIDDFQNLIIFPNRVYEKLWH